MPKKSDGDDLMKLINRMRFGNWCWGETACDMTQGIGATLREDVLRDPTAKCLAEISDLIGSKLAEPAPHAPPRDAWNSQPEAQLFDEGANVAIQGR
jgi:hypothetical protein